MKAKEVTVVPQPLIAVNDIANSSLWYQRLLGCESMHGGEDYEQLGDEGRIILQLRRWDTHEYPHMGDPGLRPCGNGVLVWFQTDDFDGAVARAGELGAEILEQPHINIKANHREVWLRDPDGYVVVLASGYGDLGAF